MGVDITGIVSYQYKTSVHKVGNSILLSKSYMVMNSISTVILYVLLNTSITFTAGNL